MNKRAGMPAKRISNLTNKQYGCLAQDTFEEILHFFVNLAPIIWTRETTILQARITGIVFAKQMSGEKTTVSDLVEETGIPRTTVQNAVDRMISDGWIVSKPDPSDGRKRLLRFSKSRIHEAGSIETLLVQNRLNSYHRMAEILDPSKHESQSREHDFNRIILDRTEETDLRRYLPPGVLVASYE